MNRSKGNILKGKNSVSFYSTMKKNEIMSFEGKDGSGDYHAQRNMPGSKRQVWCFLSYEEPKFHKREAGKEKKKEESDQQRWVET